MLVDKKKIQETKAYTCLECGKCTGTCPVARYSKTFSPRQILTTTVHNSHPEAFQSEDLWSCLTCKRCDEVCPSDIQYSAFILLIRQFAGLENRKGICSHGGILEAISRIMTVPDLQQKRTDILNGDAQLSNNSDYLYFMGCLPYFDTLFADENIKPAGIAQNTLKILNYFGIKPQVMQNEKCCGHDAYWNGDINTFQALATANLEQINARKAKTIITSCPECYRTLKIDYPLHFGKQAYEVRHISEFIEENLTSKKPKLIHDPQRITFQDPCRLGRHMGIYEAPRTALKAVSGIDFIEMSHHHKRAVCCGVSGWMNCSQVSKQIQKNRLEEVKASGADLLVTACAKCQIHFNCALQDEQLKQEIPIVIKDLTEVVAESLS